VVALYIRVQTLNPITQALSISQHIAQVISKIIAIFPNAVSITHLSCFQKTINDWMFIRRLLKTSLTYFCFEYSKGRFGELAWLIGLRGLHRVFALSLVLFSHHVYLCSATKVLVSSEKKNLNEISKNFP
jgi:hypothetical protein